MKLFISYATRSGLRLARIGASVFEGAGDVTWIWHRDRKSGEYTFDEIAENIRDCDRVLYICTKDSAVSRGQRFERNTMLAYEKEIWVIALDRAYVPPALVAFNQSIVSKVGFADESQRLAEEIAKGFPGWPRNNR